MQDSPPQSASSSDCPRSAGAAGVVLVVAAANTNNSESFSNFMDCLPGWNFQPLCDFSAWEVLARAVKNSEKY
jgi:hypothetical protein